MRRAAALLLATEACGCSAPAPEPDLEAIAAETGLTPGGEP